MVKLNGLHIAKDIRKKCINDRKFYTENGKLAFDTPFSARVAALNILKEKNISILPSELFLMSILETVILTLAREYLDRNQTYYLNMIKKVSKEYALEYCLAEYMDEFPINSVYDGKITSSQAVRNRQYLPEIYLEFLALGACEKNPAYRNCSIVFENSLKEKEFFVAFSEIVRKEAEESPKDGEYDANLYDILTMAYREYPDSIEKQLEFLAQKYPIVQELFGNIINVAIDSYREETKPVFFGPGESKVPDYEDDIFLTGAENYTNDVVWMPNVVLMAKNALVWLSQLSEKYGCEISRLNQIPDEELDTLSEMGINALWLIGIWERSVASKEIKQWTGNPEAESSAYSLKSYTISEKLGGYEALRDLRARAKARNIRLAADMVPNHTSLDSPNLYENPDMYMQLDYCPYPNYAFSGVSLSHSDKYGVFVEDHYFDRSDAAVVFKYEDYNTHKVRYIYHGNDGTNMPWNDTAQLDYLKESTRNYVKNIILNVAREFSIIRFDAAMTLTKKHFQRLWYPEPGRGGDIPTRASHGLTKEQFDSFFPTEFWRDVVDTINREAPDTLLLAEAFWLLEGYFVRTLGMHRVYNSAFMNMLRDEENAKYRDAIKLTLEFDREILKRYVNFMSNPDEKTAIEQFGDGDKYFGICLLMATLPGLPMFAHGQFEGYREKYGMEYSKSYWNESISDYLMKRHKKEVFPVLKKRHIFSQIDNFRMYDFRGDFGTDENVFVYTNSFKKEKALYIYNNAYRETEGFIKESVPFKDNSKGYKVTDYIWNAFDIENRDDTYLIYRDVTEGLEYIVSAKDLYEKGLSFRLKAYEYHLLMNFRTVKDDMWSHYGKLWHELKGRGVRSIDEEYENLALGPLHAEMKKILNRKVFDDLWDFYRKEEKDDVKTYYFFQKVADIFETARNYAGGFEDGKDVTEDIYRDFSFVLGIKWRKHVNKEIMSEKGLVYALLVWVFLRHFGRMKYGIEDPVLSADFVREWKLKDYILDVIPENEYICTKEGVLECILQAIRTQYWTLAFFAGDKTEEELLTEYVLLDSTAETIKINRFDNVLWFNRECALCLTEFLKITAYGDEKTVKSTETVRKIREISEKMTQYCEKSGYRLDSLLKLISGGAL